MNICKRDPAFLRSHNQPVKMNANKSNLNNALYPAFDRPIARCVDMLTDSGLSTGGSRAVWS